MTQEELQSVEEYLKKSYLLVRKDVLLAVLAVCGIGGLAGAWSAIQQAVNSQLAKKTTDTIIDLKENARIHSGEISKLLESAKEKLGGTLKTIKVGRARFTLVGRDETTNGPQDFKFSSGDVQKYTYPVGKELLAAWPVIQNHNGDYKSNALFWRDWEGYFGVEIEGQNLLVGGTGQKTGRFPIDIVYLFVE